MAQLFINQAKQYAHARPKYPPELYNFISSKTPVLDLVWDVGTGNGQAAEPVCSSPSFRTLSLLNSVEHQLSQLYKNVVATDTSGEQLEQAPKLHNVRYHKTPHLMTMEQLEETVSGQSTVDLVTVGQALHWFDRPEFYRQVKSVLKKPNGVIAAWTYFIPSVNEPVDAVFVPFYESLRDSFWAPERRLIDDKYTTIDFPFLPVEGEDSTGPFTFVAEVVKDLDSFLMYIRSWSAYQTAKTKGIELLKEETVRSFENAWDKDGLREKIVRYPVYLKIGRVGDH